MRSGMQDVSVDAKSFGSYPRQTRKEELSSLVPQPKGRESTWKDPTAHFASQPDIVCFSHLRWDFVYQRPQHLFSRFASRQRVYFVEEPRFEEVDKPRVDLREEGGMLKVVIPVLPNGTAPGEAKLAQKKLLDTVLAQEKVRRFFSWYYTPMSLAFSEHLRPVGVIYDCMDELSHFDHAPVDLLQWEQRLLERAEVVFTGGHSLYEFKKAKHANTHPFPSSVDRHHFAKARTLLADPCDQSPIPHPRIGFFGVIDERMDMKLIDEVASARPDWHFIFLGPVVKVDPSTLPKRANLHYLGSKQYSELPRYLSGWDVAILPFARNNATRFISPTKTPEYLAAGKPVVSTSIRDVVEPYGRLGLVRIADRPADFVDAIESALTTRHCPEWRAKVDAYIDTMSWNSTWEKMNAHLEAIWSRERRSLVDESPSSHRVRERV